MYWGRRFSFSLTVYVLLFCVVSSFCFDRIVLLSPWPHLSAGCLFGSREWEVDPPFWFISNLVFRTSTSRILYSMSILKGWRRHRSRTGCFSRSEECNTTCNHGFQCHQSMVSEPERGVVDKSINSPIMSQWCIWWLERNAFWYQSI
jgi:hypothetical protein